MSETTGLLRAKSWLARSSVNAVGRATIFVCVFNLPFWLLSTVYFIERPLLNLDALLALLVAPYSLAAAVLVLLVAWGLDACVSQALTFHFGSPLDFIRSFRFGTELGLTEYVTLESVAIGVLFLGCMVALRAQLRKPLSWQATVGVAMVALAIDMANGSSFLAPRSSRSLAVNIAGSAMGTIAVQIAHARDFGLTRSFPSPEPGDQLRRIEDWLSVHPDASVLYVVVESLGLPRNPQLRGWLDERLVAGLGSHYRLEAAEVPFVGSTTSGELRSLCALAGSYSKLSEGQGSVCLPSRLKRMGWKTHALHGFSGRMFDRQRWWPYIGLDDIWFAERLLATNPRRCGAAFRGACDADVIHAGASVAATAKSFSYVLTLNTHLPMVSVSPSAELNAQCKLAKVLPQSCELIQALGDVLNQINSEVAHATLPTMVVVVGDHAPPFGRLDERQEFSESHVPYYVLWPEAQ